MARLTPLADGEASYHCTSNRQLIVAKAQSRSLSTMQGLLLLIDCVDSPVGVAAAAKRRSLHRAQPQYSMACVR